MFGSLQAKLIAAGIVLLLIVGLFGYTRLLSAKLDAASLKADQMEQKAVTLADELKQEHDRAQMQDALLVERDKSIKEADEQAEKDRNDYQKIIRGKANAPDNCANRPIDPDIAQWMLNALPGRAAQN